MEEEGQIGMLTDIVKFELNLEGRVVIHQIYKWKEQDSRQGGKHMPRYAGMFWSRGPLGYILVYLEA